MKSWAHRSVLAVLLLCGACGPAFAYIDPGLGSIMLQSVIGTVAGAFVLLKIYWSKVVGLVSRRSHSGSGSEGRNSE